MDRYIDKLSMNRLTTGACPTFTAMGGRVRAHAPTSVQRYAGGEWPEQLSLIRYKREAM